MGRGHWRRWLGAAKPSPTVPGWVGRQAGRLSRRHACSSYKCVHVRHTCLTGCLRLSEERMCCACVCALERVVREGGPCARSSEGVCVCGGVFERVGLMSGGRVGGWVVAGQR